ncbi:hypothetical protein ACS0TY_007729 [Phlomoides rotata]
MASLEGSLELQLDISTLLLTRAWPSARHIGRKDCVRLLVEPQEVYTGTKMVFPGLKKPQDRADLIAYLKEFTSSA